ncbi:MAG: dienelactone hydrolase family protein [Bacteroidia bacterium]
MLPHSGQRIATYGPPPGTGRGVMILAHGRGADPESILELAPFFERDDLSFLAPAAAGHTWYPYSFLAPLADNEPGISSGLHTLGTLVAQARVAGHAPGEIFLGGFSQGACLAATFAARHPDAYGGLLVFSGGLIGPEGMAFDYPGSLAGVPVFIGCSDRDAHVPRWRVEETADVLRRMGADVDLRLYPNMPHTINADELRTARALIDRRLG